LLPCFTLRKPSREEAMKRLLSVAILLACSVSAPLVALDRDALRSRLDNLTSGVSRAAFTLEAREGTAERDGYDQAALEAEKADRDLSALVAGVESPEAFSAALEELASYAQGDAAKAYAAGVALNKLKERAAFLNVSLDGAAGLEQTLGELTRAGAAGETVTDSRQLLSRGAKRLITIETPIAEAVISLDDNKENRRIEALQRMMARHEVRVLSSAVDTTGEKPQTNFYVSGKKFVLEAMMRGFKGSEVAGNLRAVMVLTSGGFWGTKTIEVKVAPKAGSPETGTLGWYQAVLEKDPWKYMAETDYANLSQLGKIEDVGGERKLRLKNAKLSLWVIGPNGTTRDAIYVNSVEYGDVYVAAR